ncbi:MAG: phosphoribosylanthranilate isomerase, partial [bacterium]
ILAATCAARLDLIQLHGREDASYCRELRRHGLPPLVKVCPVANGGGSAAATPKADQLEVEYLLFDLAKGVSAESATRDRLWSAAATAVQDGQRIFLAGGLTPENVATAVGRVQPFAVDVCSGIESRPGQKDLPAVSRFIAEVHSA